MTGDGCCHGDLRRLAVTDLSDHHDIRVPAEESYAHAYAQVGLRQCGKQQKPLGLLTLPGGEMVDAGKRVISEEAAQALRDMQKVDPKVNQSDLHDIRGDSLYRTRRCMKAIREEAERDLSSGRFQILG